MKQQIIHLLTQNDYVPASSRIFSRMIALAGASLIFAHYLFGQELTNQFSSDDFLVVPVRIHFLSAKDSPSIQTTLLKRDITRILRKINGVWAQAGLHFYLESLVREEAVESFASGAISNQR